MSEFDLDLGSIERELDTDEPPRIVLGVLDGETPGEEWIEEIAQGSVLVLNIDGDLSDLASDFANEVKANGGTLVHFRGFLIVAPPQITIDTDRL